MANLKHDQIYITDQLSIHFFKMPTGWYWNIWTPMDGHPAYPKPHKSDGPHPTYYQARIDAWRKVIEGKSTTTTLYIEEVGYAWNKQIANRPPIE